jgi:hypothetical protein
VVEGVVKERMWIKDTMGLENKVYILHSLDHLLSHLILPRYVTGGQLHSLRHPHLQLLISQRMIVLHLPVLHHYLGLQVHGKEAHRHHRKEKDIVDDQVGKMEV